VNILQGRKFSSKVGMPRHQITYEMVDEHNVAEIDEMG
jgi:hypothetical protein